MAGCAGFGSGLLLQQNRMKNKLICLFLALSMGVSYFYMMRGYAVGNGLDTMTPFAFTGLCQGMDSDHFKMLQLDWKPRIASFWLARSWFYMFDPRTNEQFMNVFGSYFAVGLFAVFAILIAFIKKPAAILWAVFSGMILSSVVATSGPLIHGVQFFPWDIPAMFFITLSFLLWQKKFFVPMVACVIVGTLFKETVAITLLLLLFSHKWPTAASVGIACLILHLCLVKLTTGHWSATPHTGGFGWYGFKHFFNWELSRHWNSNLFMAGGMTVACFLFWPKTTEEFAILSTLCLFYVLMTLRLILDKTNVGGYEVRQFQEWIPMTAIYLRQKLC